jgi:hypothetical protein
LMPFAGQMLGQRRTEKTGRAGDEKVHSL